MKNGNGIINLAKNLTGKNGFNPQIIPILKFPKSENEFVCSIFNKDTKTIDIYFININSSIREQFQIENYPVETCESCKCKLGIDNLSYIGNCEIIKFFVVIVTQIKELLLIYILLILMIQEIQN